jgi:ketosteroid isomerase-like protein
LSFDEDRKQVLDYDRFEIRNVRELRHESARYGDTAVVMGKTHTKGISGGKPFDFSFNLPTPFIKDGGRWRLLAGHVSKLAAKERKLDA